jgi:hypothetical protein
MPDRVEQSIADLRRYHALGTTSRSELPERQYRRMGRAADRIHLNPDYFRKARVFATQYTPRALDALCRRCRDAEYVLGWAKMMLLLGLPDLHRRQLLDKAIAGKWSKRRLFHAIRQELGPRAPAGAGRRVEVDGAAAEKLRDAAKQFNSYMKAIRSAGTEKTLVSRVRRKARRAESEVEKLLLVLNPDH